MGRTISYPEFSCFLVSGWALLMVGTWCMGTYIVFPGARPLTEKPEGFGFEIMGRTIGSLVETIALHQCGRATQSHKKVELVSYLLFSEKVFKSAECFSRCSSFSSSLTYSLFLLRVLWFFQSTKQNETNKQPNMVSPIEQELVNRFSSIVTQTTPPWGLSW